MKTTPPHLLPVLLILLVLVADGLTKRWITQASDQGEIVPVVGEWVRLTHGTNTGMAFGLLAGAGRAWLLIVGPVTLALGGWFVYLLRTSSPVVWPLALILGGALGNLFDRASDGRVTDLVDVGLGPWRWPSFNVADAAITVGLILLIIVMIRAEAVDVPHVHAHAQRDNIGRRA